ncbi:MAG: hypothetical protein M1821_007930 [Bathelium mastoideum]|nr:MAG: hypothetical protein M1821_007930 [Bathelium mastoideum]
MNKDRMHCVYEIATYVKKRPSHINVMQDLPAIVQGWSNVSYFRKRCCLDHTAELVTLQWGDAWGALYDLCRKEKESFYRVQFSLCAIAIGKFGSWDVDGPIVRACVVIFSSDSFRRLDPPSGIHSYHSQRGFRSSQSKLKKALRKAFDERKLPPMPRGQKGRTEKSWKTKQKNDCDSDIENLASSIHQQWPAKNFVEPECAAWRYLDRKEAVRNCQELWTDWNKNAILLIHLQEVEIELAKVHTDGNQTPLQEIDQGEEDDDGKTGEGESSANEHALFVPPSLSDVLCRKTPDAIEYDPEHPTRLISPPRRKKTQKKHPEVERVIGYFSCATDQLSNQYAASMSSSLASYEMQNRPLFHNEPPMVLEFLIRDVEKMRSNYQAWFETVCTHLTFDKDPLGILELAGLTPRKTFTAFMELLVDGAMQWKDHVVNLVQALKQVQRCERLLRLHIKGDYQKLWEEVQNEGLDDDCYGQHPQWMLLEIEQDLWIRQSQGRVAIEMIRRCNSSGPNTVLQFPMGQGKSSVIIPMLLTALADGHRLARVVVLKPLLQQSLEQLRRSFGGILNRKLYYFPFSRSFCLDSSAIESLQTFFQECMADRGVAIALPEEILSLKLLTQDCQSMPRTKAATDLIRLENWLGRHTYDVYDESDEILDPRSQLIYPVGASRLLDDSCE